MGTIDIRELQANVDDVIRRVEAGERMTVTADGRPVAEMVPVRPRTWIPRDEAVALLRQTRFDPEMADVLAELRAELRAGSVGDDL